jgi:hypothetical protein
MNFQPHYLTTHLGSVPHPNDDTITGRLLEMLDIPAWPQMARRTFKENMYVQYSPSLPGIKLDEDKEKVYFDTTGDLTPALEAFYEPYLADDVDAFALDQDYAAGFYRMRDLLASTDGEWAKGQVTGPVSFGLTVTDQDLRASLYNELLADAIVKNMAMNIRWQIRQLKEVRPRVIAFVDEPYMASFGSAFISLSREQVITMLDEVFDAIHSEGALAGVHCCGNTDWSVLMATQVDILNLDAYEYMDNLALYPAELRAFLDRGGVIAWGIAPTNERIYDVTPEGLAQQLREGFANIAEKAQKRGITIEPEAFGTRSLIAPACGLGPTTVPVAERVLDVVKETAAILQG